MPGAIRTSGPSSWWGSGGIAVEILKDVVRRRRRCPRARPRHARSPSAWPPLLAGARGRPPLDVDAIADALVRLSLARRRPRARLIDLEVNPLIVRRAGGGAVAVDGRGSLADIPKEESRS